MNDGMVEVDAEMLWEKLVLFAGYAFNLSHSAEYSLISFWTMWLKVHYPAEFFAASMTVIDKEEKLEPLVNDARAHNLRVMPPDINRSTDRIEIVGEDTLYAPFQAVKGISENTTKFVLEARESLGRPFDSRAEFEAALSKLGKLGKVNARAREALEKVGAFASVTPGSLPADHPDRMRDKLELLPGFASGGLKADRTISSDIDAKRKIISIVGEIRACGECSLKGRDHPMPQLGKTPKFMVVFDSPNWQEGKLGKMMLGDSGDVVKAALKEAGLSALDGYFTSLVKSPKPKEQKTLNNEQINACKPYLQREIEILRPPVIVALGSNAVRFFAPSVKSGDVVGKTLFRPDLDATIVFGINPGQLIYDPSKITLVQQTFEKVAELVT